MKKLIKIIFAGGFVLSCGAIAMSNVSCSKKAKKTFLDFQKSGADDADYIIISHPGFRVTDYWGSAGISKEETAKLAANFMKNTKNNIDSNNNLKTDINGAFEEPFDSDNTNTIAMAFITGKKGQSIIKVFADSNIIFNSWDNKNYDTKNWHNHDDSPNYSINKFYDNLKIDQRELIKIFGNNTGDSAKGLKYQGTNKLTMQSLISLSHLIYTPSSLNKIQFSNDDKLFPITTTYTLSMTASDDTSNIVNIKSNFSFKKVDIIPTTSNITVATFSDTIITSALAPTDVKSELTNFLAMNNIANKSTFDEAWRTEITYQAPSSKKQIENAKSITITNVSDKGEISIAVLDKENVTINLTTTAIISNGFSGTNNSNEAYARFTKANYGFSDQSKWESGQHLANTMLLILKLKSAS